MNERPHFIQVLSDEHCGFAMSCAGDPNLRTPNLDRLACGGIRFERAYANSPLCTPSRGTIFSGRHAHAGPVPGFFALWKNAAPSIATLLGSVGYRSAYFGKWHCGIVRNQVPKIVREAKEDYPGQGEGQRTPEDRRAGFQDWAGFEVINAHFNTYVYRNHDLEPTRFEGYQTDVLTDLVIDYLRAYDRPEPLYLVLSVEPPHGPLEAPERFQRFNPEQLSVRPNFADMPEHRRQLALYYAMIENLDWNIGRLMAALEELPAFRGERTCLSYISDHGEMMGSHGLFGRKVFPYEEAIRIPAIFHWPGQIPSQGAVPGLFSLVDFAPTLAGLAGVPIPTWMQGCDWASVLRGKTASGPSDVLLEITESPMWSPAFLNWRGFTDGRWKYAFYENRREELFDLEADPFEQLNLALTAPDQCRAMRERLLSLLAAMREPYFDVLIQHGVEPPPAVSYLAPKGMDPVTQSVGGFPADWNDWTAKLWKQEK